MRILKKLGTKGTKSFDEVTKPIKQKIVKLGITRKDVEREIEKYRKSK